MLETNRLHWNICYYTLLALGGSMTQTGINDLRVRPESHIEYLGHMGHRRPASSVGRAWDS